MSSATELYEDKCHVLVVDDDARIRSLIMRYLTQEGFMVAAAEDAAIAKTILAEYQFDAIVLDVMMPGQDGVSLTEELKANPSTPPIILLTALGEVQDRIRGLESGADDYLAKPFEPMELVLRLKAITRRAQQSPRDNTPTDYMIGKWIYAPKYSTLRHEQADGDITVQLTSGENALLGALAQNYGQHLNRDKLAELCGIDSGERTIDVQITRLRRKIEDNPKEPKSIQTIRGKGYLLNAEPLS